MFMQTALIIMPSGWWANRYPCGDGKWIVLNTMGDNSWEKLCRALDRQDWLEEAAFRTAKARYDRMAELVDRIDAALASRSRDEWGQIFDREGLIWGPVLTLDEVAGDRQAEAIEMFPSIDHERLGTYRSVRIPMRIRDAEVRPRGPAPDLGQHTREVLAAAGFSDEEIARLIEQGAIGSDR